MGIEEVIEPLTSMVEGLSPQEGFATIYPLILFVIGMVIYAIFVFKFERYIARKDVFRLSKGGASGLRRIGYGLEYVFLFPAIAFVWFFVISTLLSLLSQVLSIGDVFLISMSILATIRVCAYYNEILSREIAKLIPFALMAVFLLDILKVREAGNVAIAVFNQIPEELSTLAYYFIFIVILELFLRLVTMREKKPKKGKKK